jgi:hypothetical protein
VAPRTSAPWNRAQPSVSSIVIVTPPAVPDVVPRRDGGTSTPPAPGITGSRNGAPYEAASSRATPLCPSRSGRLGVTSTTRRWSASGIASRSGVPGAASVSSSQMPSLSSPRASSAVEQSMPWLVTPPIARAAMSSGPFFPPGTRVPTRANG